MLVRFVLSAVTLSVLVVSQPASAGDRYRRESVWVDKKDLAPDAAAAATISHILYVNRCIGGCTVTPGLNDSRNNTSSIAGAVRNLTEYSGSQETFDETVACLRELYGPYDVDIVTEDPGEVTHHEAMFAGRPEQLGMAPSVLGVAPASCEPLNNVISFTFANVVPDDVEENCWTLAQESAHAFGLPNHVLDCSDPMTYTPGCGRKYFRNKALSCGAQNDAGDFLPAACVCGVGAQNSHAGLIDVFGPGTPPAPTDILILQPAADATVSDEFEIFFSALNPRLVDHVELWINGTKYAEKPGNTYELSDRNYNFTAPKLADGVIDVEIRAYDDLGTESIESVTVNKGAPCGNADACFDFQECSEGRCEYPPPAGMLGDTCEFAQYCLEGTCTEHDGDAVCAITCNAQVAGSCPDGFDCVAEGACFPHEEAGGCCSVAGSKRREAFPLVALGLFGLGLVVLRRRRA